jgi:hypothetical protein
MLPHLDGLRHVSDVRMMERKRPEHARQLRIPRGLSIKSAHPIKQRRKSLIAGAAERDQSVAQHVQRPKLPDVAGIGIWQGLD